MLGEIQGYEPEPGEGAEDDKQAEIGLSGPDLVVKDSVKLESGTEKLIGFEEKVAARKAVFAAKAESSGAPSSVRKGLLVGHRSREHEPFRGKRVIEFSINQLLTRYGSVLVPKLAPEDSQGNARRFVLELRDPKKDRRKGAQTGEGKKFIGTAREILRDLEEYLRS